MRRYTQEELNFIEINYITKNALEIANILNRTVGSVKNKANQLKLYKRSKIKEGEVFGRLVVIKKDETSTPGNPYYFVKCSCDGKMVSVRGSALREKNTVSCGCYQKESRFGDLGVSSWNQIIAGYRSGAKGRGHTFELSFEYFVSHAIQNCHYCGAKPRKHNKYLNSDGFFSHPRSGRKDPSVIEKAWIELNGLDRIDNDKGYIEGNIVPCCTICNYAKHSLTYEEFITYINNLVLYRNTLGDSK